MQVRCRPALCRSSRELCLGQNDTPRAAVPLGRAGSFSPGLCQQPGPTVPFKPCRKREVLLLIRAIQILALESCPAPTSPYPLAPTHRRCHAAGWPAWPARHGCCHGGQSLAPFGYGWLGSPPSHWCSRCSPGGRSAGVHLWDGKGWCDQEKWSRM